MLKCAQDDLDYLPSDEPNESGAKV